LDVIGRGLEPVIRSRCGILTSANAHLASNGLDAQNISLGCAIFAWAMLCATTLICEPEL
jgi:hypothetical protein